MTMKKCIFDYAQIATGKVRSKFALTRKSTFEEKKRRREEEKPSRLSDLN